MLKGDIKTRAYIDSVKWREFMRFAFAWWYVYICSFLTLLCLYSWPGPSVCCWLDLNSKRRSLWLGWHKGPVGAAKVFRNIEMIKRMILIEIQEFFIFLKYQCKVKWYLWWQYSFRLISLYIHTHIHHKDIIRTWVTNWSLYIQCKREIFSE